MPSVLETTFENPTDQGGLGLSSVQYNLLYSIYAWTNAVMVRNHAQQCAMHASSLVCFHSRTLQFMPCLFPVLFFILWSLFFFFGGGGVYETGGWGRLPCGQSWQSFEPHAFLWPVPDWCLPLCSRKPKIRQFLNQAVHICFAHPFCAWSFLTHGGAFPLCLCIAFAGAFSPFPSLTRSFMPGRELQAVSADALRAPHLR